MHHVSHNCEILKHIQPQKTTTTELFNTSI